MYLPAPAVAGTEARATRIPAAFRPRDGRRSLRAVAREPGRRRRSHAGLLRAALFGLAAAALVAAVAPTRPWRGLEERALGAIVAARGPSPWNPEVIVVAIDDGTLRQIGWPVPRSHHAVVLSALANAGAAAVAYDIFFADPARDGPDGDALFARVAEAYGRAVFAVEMGSDRRADGAALTADLAGRSLSVGSTPAGEPYRSAVLPYGPLRRAGALAHVQSAESASGVVLGERLFVDVAGRRLPALALAALARGTGESLGAVAQEPGGARVGGRFVPVDPRGGALASFRGLPREGVVTFDALLSALKGGEPGTFPPALAERFRGRYVVVGQTAQGIGDHGPLATGEPFPLVSVHAALLSDLIEGRPVRELPVPVQLAAILAAGALLTAAALFLRPWIAGACLAAALGAVLAAAFALAGRGLLVAPVGPIAAAALSSAAALAGRLAAEDRERRILRDAFGAYVDAAVLARLLEDPERYLALGGAKKTLSILFSDIKGYTGLSNERPPEEVVALLREYLEAMTSIVKNAEGRVDKMMGDGILAVFGDPIPHDDHAMRAVEVGLAMQEAVARLQAGWTVATTAGLQIRVGVATGEVFVGNIGSANAKIEYTVLGPTVNLASRLEGKAPPGGVLVSGATREACRGRFEFQAVPGLALKGFAEAVEAHLAVGRRVEGEPARSGLRLPTKAAVQVRTPRERGAGRVDNVSAGGLHVATALGVEVGEFVEVEFPSLPDLAGAAPVVVRGEVRHRRPGSGAEPGFGMSILRADSHRPEAMRQFVALYFGDPIPADGAAFTAEGGEVLRMELGELYGRLVRDK